MSAAVERTYTDAEVHAALTALVANLGNVSKTAKETGISRDTLTGWRDDRHPQLYADLEATYARQVEAVIIQRARKNAEESGAAVELAIERAVKVLNGTAHLSAREAAQVARDMSQVHSQSVDKLLTLTGRPTAITESRELVGIIESLETSGVLKVQAVDSTAIEEGKAESE